MPRHSAGAFLCVSRRTLGELVGRVIKAKGFDDQECAERNGSETEGWQDHALQEAETKPRSDEDDARAEPDQEHRIDGADHRPMEEGRQKFTKDLTLGLSPVLPSRQSGFALQFHNSPRRRICYS